MLNKDINSNYDIITHQIGDLIKFKSMPDLEWLLIDVTDVYYIFLDIWNINNVWRSKKGAPVHNISNILSKQSKSESN